MNTMLKIFFGFIAAGLLLGLVTFAMLPRVIGWGVSTAVAASRGKAERNLAEIVTVTLPDGYQADYALKAGGYIAAGFRRGEREHLIFIQGPADLQINEADLENMADSQYNSHNGRSMKVVSQDEITVRGLTARRVVSEGINSVNQPYRQMNVIFQGNDGPALLNLGAPIAQWNQAEVDAMLASIQ